jgi:hypothetical protein
MVQRYHAYFFSVNRQRATVAQFKVTGSTFNEHTRARQSADVVYRELIR